MRSRVFLMAAIFSLIPFALASAEEMKINAEATLTGQYVDVQGEKAKFNEYRDIHSGATGDAGFQYERDKYYLDFSGREIGRKDQSYELLGGKWGSFRYDFKYDELPHNFTTGARTFYSGFGGANLTYTPEPPSTSLPNTNIATWNSFDYSVERKNYGGGFKLDMLKPFFFSAAFAREERRGVYPIGTPGTSPGGVTIELPAPINYLTDTFRVEAGYLKNPLTLNLGYTYGQFQNDNANLNFRNPATDNTAATTDRFTMPPDSDFFKFDLKGGLRLPWHSKLNANLSYGRNESSRTLLNTYVTNSTAADSNIGVQGLTGVLLSHYVFDGRMDIQNYNFVLTSNPIYWLDGKVFYKYYQTTNKSTQIMSTDPSPNPLGAVQEILDNEERLFDYLTYKYGAKLGFKLPMSFHLDAGYTRGHFSRKREDIPKNNDDLYETEVRWSGVDFMVARAGYERLNRKVDFVPPEVTDPADPAQIENYVRRYDAAAKERDTVKAYVDLFPVEDLSLSVGYKWKDTRYKDTTIGLRSWTGNEWHVDADYLIAKRVRLFGYYDYEYGKLDQFARTFTSGTNADPSLPATTAAFNWTVTETDRNHSYGLGADVYAIPKKLTFKFQHSYVRSQGFADYTYLRDFVAGDAGRNNDNIDIDNLDNYSLRYYLVKATYNPSKALSFSVGWAYEKYVLDDAQFNGYQYIPLSSTGTTQGYLTGAYANPNYRANVWFANLTYLFF